MIAEPDFELLVAPALLAATEAAAAASAPLVGRGDKERLDAAAVDAMRASFENAPFDGTVVVGEGEKDAAPMLYTGEHLGAEGPRVDIAVDPLDGTTIASRGASGAICVVAAAPFGALPRTRLSYMDKLVVGSHARGSIDIECTPAQNLTAIAEALNRPPKQLVVAMLDRPRNEPYAEAVRAIGARVKFFGDGDIVNALLAVLGDERVDVLMGIGGAPEGVITACAVRALGGDMCGRFWLRDERDRAIARSEGIDVDYALSLGDLCASPMALFAATGVTDGDLLRGCRTQADAVRTHSIVISSFESSVRYVDTVRAPLAPQPPMLVGALEPQGELVCR
jgi:fructose-1,6-bisphosphatase II